MSYCTLAFKEGGGGGGATTNNFLDAEPKISLYMRPVGR